MTASSDTEKGGETTTEPEASTTPKLPNGGYGWVIVTVAILLNAVTWGALPPLQQTSNYPEANTKHQE